MSGRGAEALAGTGGRLSRKIELSTVISTLWMWAMLSAVLENKVLAEALPVAFRAHRPTL